MDTDNKDYAICNHCDCDKKDACKRYDKSVLSSYDFEAICFTEWFMPKEVK